MSLFAAVIIPYMVIAAKCIMFWIFFDTKASSLDIFD